MTEHKSIEEIAKLFHETYERLAPQYGYETRADTKEFDKDSPNGKLMIAVIAELIPHLNSRNLAEVTGETSDGYHTFNELYEFRKLYNACLFNEWSARGLYKVHKSKKHSDGEGCFGGGWFIVTATLPTGQISNHYELKDWDLFKCEEREKADVWDGHTPQDVAKRLEALTKLPVQNSRNLLERFAKWLDEQGIVVGDKTFAQRWLDEFIESEGLK